MFEKNQEEFLIRKLKRNEVVLFLGAGFSLDAKNKDDINLPLGGKLSELIWELVYPDKEYESTSLPIMYELLLKSGKSFGEIQKFLNDTFLVKKYASFYDFLTNAFWYKIYSTNIDNLLDKIYSKSKQQVDILKYPNDDHKDVDNSLGKVQHIYLNGKLPC